MTHNHQHSPSLDDFAEGVPSSLAIHCQSEEEHQQLTALALLLADSFNAAMAECGLPGHIVVARNREGLLTCEMMDRDR